MVNLPRQQHPAPDSLGNRSTRRARQAVYLKVHGAKEGLVQRVILLTLAWHRATVCRSPVLQNQAASKVPHLYLFTQFQEWEKSREVVVIQILEEHFLSLLRSKFVLHWKWPMHCFVRTTVTFFFCTASCIAYCYTGKIEFKNNMTHFTQRLMTTVYLKTEMCRLIIFF